MDRRDWLKILMGGSTGFAIAALAPGAVSSPDYLWTSSPGIQTRDSYFIVTDRPRKLATQVLELSGQEKNDVHITVRHVSPIGQDLTVIRNGVLVNPTIPGPRPEGVGSVSDESFADLAGNLRRTSTPGTHMVSIEPRPLEYGRIIFECDGRIVDSVEPKLSYERIVIPGEQGDTVFKLRDGSLSVVSSSCRHELCKRSGSVSAGRIICAPNHLVASIGNPYAAVSSVDAITG